MAVRTRLALEELDARTLPAPLALAPPTGPIVVQQAPAPSHPLHGAGGGMYSQRFGIDSGAGYTFQGGQVSLANLGTFHVTGWVQGVGMIQNGRATGQLTLTNAQGSITLALHGPTQPGFSPLPSELVYSATGGTGAYKGFAGYGVVGIQFHPYYMPIDPPVATPLATPTTAPAPTPMPQPIPVPMPPIWNMTGSFDMSFS